MPKNRNASMEEWVGLGFKGAVTVISTLLLFFMSQLNATIASLTAQLKSMEIHQIDTDKRVAAIEIARQINMEDYKKVVGDVQRSVSDIQDIKNNVTQVTQRLNTMAEFMTKRIK